jgi:predicted  nucleic acid-binding Zn-ribbon protein
LHPDLKAVIELQQIDQRIAELTAQIDSLPTEIQHLEAQLHEFIHTYEERKQRLTENQKERRELEAEIQSITTRISKHKDQLYEVKTNEQYRAMLKEIEGEEAKIRKIEDQLLEEMIEAEQLEEHIHDAAARLDGEKARVAGEVKQLQALRQTDVEERERLEKQRQKDAAGLSAGILDLYERIRAHRGQAVAEVREDFCTACNVRLRPQLFNEVRDNQALLTCENCDRILYYIEPPPTESAEAQGTDARTST